MTSAVESVCGWELNNPDPRLFESHTLGEYEDNRQGETMGRCPGDCGSCEFLNECSGPIQFRCMTPRNSNLMELGGETSSEGEKIKYFALLSGDELRFIRLVQPDHYWATMSYIDREEVPDWALAGVKS